MFLQENYRNQKSRYVKRFLDTGVRVKEIKFPDIFFFLISLLVTQTSCKCERRFEYRSYNLSEETGIKSVNGAKRDRRSWNENLNPRLHCSSLYFAFVIFFVYMGWKIHEVEIVFESHCSNESQLLQRRIRTI